MLIANANKMQLVYVLTLNLMVKIDAERHRVREDAEKDAKDMNLNCVRICFEAFDYNQNMNFPICGPVYSRPIANQSKCRTQTNCKVYISTKWPILSCRCLSQMQMN